MPERWRQSVERSQSKESIAKAAVMFNLTPNDHQMEEETKDLPMSPKKIKSTVLSEAEEQIIVAFRKMTEFPLDDVLYIV